MALEADGHLRRETVGMRTVLPDIQNDLGYYGLCIVDLREPAELLLCVRAGGIGDGHMPCDHFDLHVFASLAFRTMD